MSDDEIRPGVRRLFQLASTRPPDSAGEADAEIRFHLEARVEQLVANGMTRRDAEAEARRRFGDVERARDDIARVSTQLERRRSGALWLRELWQDLRFAVRGLRRSPAFTAVATVCLAIGIGTSTAIYAVTHGVIIAPLEFRESEQLVRVWRDGAVPAGVFEVLAREQRSYSALGGVEGGSWRSMRAGDAPARVLVANATDGFFATLGTRPLLGRTFRAGDNAPGVARSVVLSHAAWQRYFNANRGVLGQTIQLDGVSHEIVGVMPDGFAYPSAAVDGWTPAAFTPGAASYWWSTYFMLVGRLAPNATVQSAEAEANVLLGRARAAFPMRMPDDWGANVKVTLLKESIVGNVRSTMYLLLAAAGVVLLIAVVNVATLVAGRSSTRLKELAVRTALGAARGRLVRLLLAECVVVALLAAGIGLAFAFATVDALRALLPPNTPRVADIAIDAPVVLATTIIAVLCAFGVGLIPALGASTPELATTLRSDDRSGVARGTRRTASILATAQVALAVVLVTCAGFLVKSVRQLQQVDVGFTARGAVTSTIPLPAFPNDTATRTVAFVNAMLDGMSHISEIESAGVSSALPFGDGISTAAMEIESHPTAPGDVPPLPQLTVVSPNFLETLQVPLLEGRSIEATDRAGSERVGVIDEVAARTYWPGQRAIGQRIRYVWNKDWITVVGVVRSVKRDSLSATVEPALYLPLAQGAPRDLRLLVRSSLEVASLTRKIADAVHGIDANVPIGEVRSLEDIVTGSASRSRFIALLVSLFSCAALALGAIGIYGVSSASVTQRRREIGVRMALGATAPSVVRMVLSQNLVIALVGVCAGAALSVAAGRAMRSMLFGVQPFDATILAAVALLLALVTILSALGPALRASRVDPLTAVRES